MGKSVVYRDTAEWAEAFATAKAALKGTEGAPATLQVLTHLAWRGPTSTVQWYKGTAKGMIENATRLGVEPGMPLPEAMATTMAALPKDKATTALVKATKAMTAEA
jgi:hypothetical protein